MGGTLGHCMCTGLAVVGGRMIAQKISVRTGENRLGLSLVLYCKGSLALPYFPWSYVINKSVICSILVFGRLEHTFQHRYHLNLLHTVSDLLEWILVWCWQVSV